MSQDLVTPECGFHRRFELGAIVGQVFQVHYAAHALDTLRDRVGDAALVKSVAGRLYSFQPAAVLRPRIRQSF